MLANERTTAIEYGSYFIKCRVDRVIKLDGGCLRDAYSGEVLESDGLVTSRRNALGNHVLRCGNFNVLVGGEIGTDAEEAMLSVAASARCASSTTTKSSLKLLASFSTRDFYWKWLRRSGLTTMTDVVFCTESSRPDS